jgi:hypothetical protein
MSIVIQDRWKDNKIMNEDELNTAFEVLKHECVWFAIDAHGGIFKYIGEDNSGTFNVTHIVQTLQRYKISKWVYNLTLQRNDPQLTIIDPQRKWQLKLLSLLQSTPDSTYIHWYWNPVAEWNSSSLCKYLAQKHNALIVTGNKQYAYQSFLRYTQKRSIIIVNIMENQEIDYDLLENIKDGMLCDFGHMILFNSPHVIVFANRPPEYANLKLETIDRLLVTEI